MGWQQRNAYHGQITNEWCYSVVDPHLREALNKNYYIQATAENNGQVRRSKSHMHSCPAYSLHRLPRSLRQTQGASPWTPYMLPPFKYQIIKHHVEQYLNQSLRIACKALSLDTPPTIPLLGLIGVFRWVHLATTDSCHSRLCSSYPLQPSVMFWRCFISTCVYLSCWHLKTPLRASQDAFWYMVTV